MEERERPDFAGGDGKVLNGEKRMVKIVDVSNAGLR